MGWKERFLPRIGILTPNDKDILIKNGRKGNYLLLWFQRIHGIGRVIQKVGKQTAQISAGYGQILRNGALALEFDPPVPVLQLLDVKDGIDDAVPPDS